MSQMSIRSHSVGKQLFALKLESFVHNPFCKRDPLKNQGHLGTRTLHWVDLHQDKSILVFYLWPEGGSPRVGTPSGGIRENGTSYRVVTDVWDFQGKSGSSGSCQLFLGFLVKIAVPKMSGKALEVPDILLPDIRRLLILA